MKDCTLAQPRALLYWLSLRMIVLHLPFAGASERRWRGFCSLTGGTLGHRNVGRRSLEKAIEAAGLPHLRWHDLRHVCASVMIEPGASVAYLARLLGHANRSITAAADRYRSSAAATFGASRCSRVEISARFSSSTHLRWPLTETWHLNFIPGISLPPGVRAGAVYS